MKKLSGAALVSYRRRLLLDSAVTACRRRDEHAIGDVLAILRAILEVK